MKHATKPVLKRLEPVLERLRILAGLNERSVGVFYLHGSAFLHFHEDACGIFADVRVGIEWERLPVNTGKQRSALIRRIRRLVSESTPRVFSVLN
jgi:hypothetical protein